MRELIRKKNQNQQDSSISLARTRNVLRQSGLDPHPIPRLQPARSSQTALGIPRSQEHHPEHSLSITTGLPFGYDFSRIPVLSNVQRRIQAKLTETSGDIYEQEAERVAHQVTRAPEPLDDDQEHSPIKRVQANDPVEIELPAIVDEALHSSGRPLDSTTRGDMEPRFGHDFSRVRVHADETAAEAARSLYANAFTVGSHIVFGEGKLAPNTSNGRRLLAHELTHSVQQSAPGGQAKGAIQRDKNTEQEVKRVISPNVQLREEAVKGAETQLNKRLAKRQAEIQAMLDELGPNPKSQKAKDRAKLLRKDLDKNLETIIKEPDSRYVNKELRKDIIASAKTLDAQKLKLTGAQAQWSKYDAIFAGKEVATALGGQSLGAGELKALIAQESGDLTETDTKGDIAGIAQLGTKEEKRAGGKPGDRKKPEKAILLAAKIMNMYANDLDKALKVKPTGDERKKFIMAAYNAGVNAITTAQNEAIKMGRDGKTWESLIKGEEKSPLHKALEATYKADKVEAKYKEVTEYVEKILARLP